MPKPSKPPKPCFCNVDLEIESAGKLDLLIKEMGRRVYVLYSGPLTKRRRHFASFEIARTCRGPDATIHALCSVVDDLSPAARKIWNAARKTFDVGYELRPSERYSAFTLRTDTLKRVVSIGGRLAVTYYHHECRENSSVCTSVKPAAGKRK